MDRLKVFTAKRKLYLALLDILPDDLTKDDLRMMGCLCKDREIQDYLTDALSCKPNAQPLPLPRRAAIGEQAIVSRSFLFLFPDIKVHIIGCRRFEVHEFSID